MRKVLFIDNFDSFTYNLVDEFLSRDCYVSVLRNNIHYSMLSKDIRKNGYGLIVISPGPSTPSHAGVCKDLIRDVRGEIPVFGVCLGHQAICEVYGGQTLRCSEIYHGKHCKIRHDSNGIFTGVSNPFTVGRYHSLCCGGFEESDLSVNASTESGIVMGVEDSENRVWGVQFHPESILTAEGSIIIDNVIDMSFSGGIDGIQEFNGKTV
ncbi:MAG: anthranilate synthase component II [Candidatus Muiribacteriaceae bacterium]